MADSIYFLYEAKDFQVKRWRVQVFIYHHFYFRIRQWLTLIMSIKFDWHL
jgi:hypothetical protein